MRLDIPLNRDCPLNRRSNHFWYWTEGAKYTSDTISLLKHGHHLKCVIYSFPHTMRFLIIKADYLTSIWIHSEGCFLKSTKASAGKEIMILRTFLTQFTNWHLCGGPTPCRFVQCHGMSRITKLVLDQGARKEKLIRSIFSSIPCSHPDKVPHNEQCVSVAVWQWNSVWQCGSDTIR